MLKRILSTTTLWLVTFGSLYLFGAHAGAAIITLLAALTLYEFYDMAAKLGARPFRWMGIFFSVAITAGPYLLAYFIEEKGIGENLPTGLVDSLPNGLVVVALLAACIRVLGERDTSNRTETLVATIFGILYVPYLLHFLVAILMRDGYEGENLALWLWTIVVSKFCDVGALLSGMAFGRNKMSPTISPKKTWEGAVGGVLVSAGLGAGIAYFASAYFPTNFHPWVAALMAAPIALITIVSDLLESVFKRRADVKDSGAMIPGIGGAFDLADSLILSAPLAYFLFLFLE